MADTSKLHAWFTPREVTTYFGKRTQDEIDYAARVIGRLTPEHRQALKRILSETNAMRLAEKSYGKR